MAESITLKYYDTEWHSQAFTALSVKGLDDPDKVQICGFQFPAIDGSIIEQVLGFRRVITADLGTVQTHALRVWVHNFLNSETRLAHIGDDNVFSIIGTPEGFESYWQHDSELGRSFTLELLEKRIRWRWATQASGDMQYIINHIEVTGTQTSPELFTTNSGKLAFNYDTTPYPDFGTYITEGSHIVTIIANGTPYQDAKINLYGEPSANGAAMDFYLAVSDAGNPSSDGKYYVDICILAQEKT